MTNSITKKCVFWTLNSCCGLRYLYKILGLQKVEILEKIQKREKKCGEAGDRTADLRITTILWNQNSGALAHSATKDLMQDIGFLIIYRKVVPLLLCQHWFMSWTTVFFNFDRLLLKDKTTLPNCFGMNGHQKTLSFSNRKPIKGQKGQNAASIYL